MKALLRYTVVSSLIAALLVLVALPLLDSSGRAGLLLAAAVTLPLQIGLFALLVGAHGDANRFMTFWGLGMLGRMVVLALVGLSIRFFDTVDPTVAIMSTVGLFFIFLLLEPVFLVRNGQATEYAR